MHLRVYADPTAGTRLDSPRLTLTMSLPEWIFRSMSLALALIAVACLGYGLFADRLRGLTKARRCPKCWYDLSGATPNGAGAWLCAECGHVEATAARLHRGRRRGWLLAAALPLAALGALAWVWPTIDRDGWRATVPMWSIVKFWPIDEVAWMEGRGARDSMVEEMDRRVDRNKASGPMLRAWARRVESKYRALGRGVDVPGRGAGAAAGISSANRAAVLLCVDLACTFDTLATVDDSAQSGGRWCIVSSPQDPIPSAVVASAVVGPWVSDTQESIANGLMWMAHPDSWLDQGGTASYRWSGTSLLLIGPPELMEEAGCFLSGLELAARLAYADCSVGARIVALGSDGTQVVIRDVGDVQVGLAPAESSLRERVDSVRARVVGDLDPESWIENGGDFGLAGGLAGLLIIRHTPEVQAKIDDLLTELRRNRVP